MRCDGLCMWTKLYIASIHVVEGSRVTTYLRTATSNHTTMKHHFVEDPLFDFSFHQYIQKLKTERQTLKNNAKDMKKRANLLNNARYKPMTKSKVVNVPCAVYVKNPRPNSSIIRLTKKTQVVHILYTNTLKIMCTVPILQLCQLSLNC